MLVSTGCIHSEDPEKHAEEDVVFCTLEWAPVCGKVDVQCVTTPCDPVQETFSNLCSAEAAGAYDIVEGECASEVQDAVTSDNVVLGSILGTFGKSGETKDGFAWYVNYTFHENGTYVVDGYPDLYEEGEYKVIEQDENGALVQILDPNMAPLKGYDIEFIFSPDGDYFIKQHQDVYYRQG